MLSGHKHVGKTRDPFLSDALADGNGGSTRLRREYNSLLNEERGLSYTSTRQSALTCRLERVETLFAYQLDASTQVQGHFLSGDNSRRSVLLSMPTGAGKTRTALVTMLDLIAKNRVNKVVWLAPTVELVYQAVGALREVWPSRRDISSIDICTQDFTGLLAKQRFPRARVWLCTLQKLSASRRAAQLDEKSLVIFDEAHCVVARTFLALHREAEISGALTLGLTATPGRRSLGETASLRAAFPILVVPASLKSDPIGQLRHNGVLARLMRREVALPHKHRHLQVTDVGSISLPEDELVAHPVRFWCTVETLAEGCGGQTLVFGASIAHCAAITAALRSKGRSARLLTHEIGASQREETLRQFAEEGFEFLVNKALLSTGYDLPTLADVALTTPIRSPILWEQMVGRVARGPAVGGNQSANVWEIDDHWAMHGDVMGHVRFASDFWG